MEIFNALKRFRKEFGLSQKDVADMLGITPQSYYVYERAASPVMPSVRVLKKIAVSFNVSMDYLSGLSDMPRPLEIRDQEFFNAVKACTAELQAALRKVGDLSGRVQDNQPAQWEAIRRADAPAD